MSEKLPAGQFCLKNAPEELLPEVCKRVTMNLLIHGAAHHVFFTSHHLVKASLDRISPELVGLYDEFTLGAFITNWHGMAFLGRGSEEFWEETQLPEHMFQPHALLINHGRDLALASKDYAEKRAVDKEVPLDMAELSMSAMSTLSKILGAEEGQGAALIELARKVTVDIWGIDEGLLDGELTRDVAFGPLREPSSDMEHWVRNLAAGYGGVMREQGELRVVAKGLMWPVLSHELTKGTMELIGLHQFADFDEETYKAVMLYADFPGLEPWLLQAGGELWRRLLAALPQDVSLPNTVMHLAMMPSPELENLMAEVVMQSSKAKESFRIIGKGGDIHGNYRKP